MSEAASVQIVLLPNVELNMESVTVTNVFVKAGDRVAEGQALGAVETQKANIEIDSPYAGFVHEVFIVEGEEIGEKAPVCSIGEAAPEVPVAGTKAKPVPVVSAPAIPPSADPVPAVEGKVRASPVARNVAKSLGLDLRQITGTGPSGRITRADVEAVHAKGAGAPSVSKTRPPSPPLSGDWQPFPPVRAALIAQMEAGRNIPIFSVSRQFDVTALVRREPGITFTHRLVCCLGHALALHPALRTSMEAGRFRIEEVSVAVAMDTATGLVAPAVRNPQNLSLAEVAATVQLLKARADAGQLKRADYERAPFALSNLGMLGVDVFQPSVFHGQCAVLGTGRAVDGAAGRKVAWFTLACDHRAADGAEAARFFQTLQQEINAR